MGKIINVPRRIARQIECIRWKALTTLYLLRKNLKTNFLAVLQTIKTDGLFVLVCIEKMDVK